MVGDGVNDAARSPRPTQEWRSAPQGCLYYLTLTVGDAYISPSVAGWSSLVARWAHNPKVEGSNPSPATTS